MLFKDALKKAEKSKDVKELEKKDYLLTSGISILKAGTYEINEWILTYYNLAKDEVVQVNVDENTLKIGDSGKPLSPTKTKIEINEIKTNVESMLEKAKIKFLEFRKPLSQLIISLHEEKDEPIWRFSFVTKTLEVVTIEIDAKNGEIKKSECQSLSKNC